jgi:hypothetical protein
MPTAAEVATATWSANWPDDQPEDVTPGRDSAGWRLKYAVDIGKVNQQRINTLNTNLATVDSKVSALDVAVKALDTKMDQVIALLNELVQDPPS